MFENNNFFQKGYFTSINLFLPLGSYVAKILDYSECDPQDRSEVFSEEDNTKFKQFLYQF